MRRSFPNPASGNPYVRYRTVKPRRGVQDTWENAKGIDAVLLQDLPTKTLRHLYKSITWTDVDAAVPSTKPLRRLVGRIAHPGRWVLRVQRTAMTRLRGFL